MTYAININDVSKTFGCVKSLDSITFKVPFRSIFGLLGPNGAGKTTLFSTITNFIKPDSGTIKVLDIDTRQISFLRGRLATLPQDAQFQRNIPILEQLVFFRLLDGCSRSQAKKEILQFLDIVKLRLIAKQRIGALSHGMLKTIGVIQAFFGHPEVILLDEPTAGLDPANARRIRDLIKQLQGHATIMISSHNLTEIQDLCDHVAILDNGKLVCSKSIDEITLAASQYKLALSRSLTDAEKKRLNSLCTVKDIKLVTVQQNAQMKGAFEYLIAFEHSKTTDQDTVIAAVLHQVLNMGITPRKLIKGCDLETQFLKLTGHNKNHG